MARATTANTQIYTSIKGAAERIHYSEWMIRELIDIGKLPAYRLSDKPGSTIRVKIADIDALFQPVIPTEIAASR